MTNPLLTMDGLPPFSQIKPEHVKPAIEHAIADCKKRVASVLDHDENFTWDNLVAPLEEVGDRLSRIWSPVSHLNGVLNSEELRQAYEECLPMLSEYSTWMGQHQGLFNAFDSLAKRDNFKKLSLAQQKDVNNTLRDFRLSGIALEPAQKARFGEIKSRLSDLSSRFANQVLDATQAWIKHITDEKQLSGLPESAIAAAKAQAESRELDGWVFTLDIPSYLPIMMYADDASLREELYRAYCTRASDQGPNAGEFDNTAVIEETLALKQELAQLLGYENYAQLSLATKMAENEQQVLDFLDQLAQRSYPQGKAELAELTEFAREHYEVDALNAWDVSYYGEKLKQHKYTISDEELRPYFPANKVVHGLFETVKRLFGVKVTERFGVEVWHPDVRFFDIYGQDGELRGSFYLDLYARANKRGGAWMDDCMGRRYREDGSLQKPVAYLTCNFNGPVGDQPALFTHGEVETLFHEFGHGIHHMLTKVDVAGVSGINGVAWDAVELPSQFLENWCWQPEALAFISGHYETGEPLPADLLERMLAARNFHSSLMMLRQLEFSLFDFRLHMAKDGAKPGQAQAILDKVRESVSVLPPPSFNRFQHGFAHIFAGGYAAGYYSYKWAEVLSSDAFSRFEEEGIFCAKTGRDFLHAILEQGGSKEPMELFKQFRGREPKIDALLRHSGITA
ncbi:oligopeptidase A [Oceanisphaera pacifica]|uniref:oligopeptidase A n=1 Tax=Oceanisphaera pacifica TaxID=2818389 RepID=A0ABS3NI19_9GAMM|nr:oligopeptidase A [Oceanisphaera pacifica]MBO1519930.1 oligopeptidase A [Oceanisphaera pacifica]